MNMVNVFTKGIYRENAVFRLVIGLCPTLAITTTVFNSIGMGIAVIAVLVSSNLFISMIRNLVPKNIRIPIYIVIIATFVTIIDLLISAYQPGLSRSLGIFIPLIVVNCIILGRAEAFASRNTPVYAIADGLGIGLGFTLAIVLIAAVRELLGNGSLSGFPVFPRQYQPVLVMIMAPGAFLTLGYILGLLNWFEARRKRA
jgi:electron transport complex protein RnfE